MLIKFIGSDHIKREFVKVAPLDAIVYEPHFVVCEQDSKELCKKLCDDIQELKKRKIQVGPSEIRDKKLVFPLHSDWLCIFLVCAVGTQ